jgi:hypothetical protein
MSAPRKPDPRGAALIAAGFVSPERREALEAYLASLDFLERFRPSGAGREHHDERAAELRRWLPALAGLASDGRAKPLLDDLAALAAEMERLGLDVHEHEEDRQRAERAFEGRRGVLETSIAGVVHRLTELARSGPERSAP